MTSLIRSDTMSALEVVLPDMSGDSAALINKNGKNEASTSGGLLINDPTPQLAKLLTPPSDQQEHNRNQ